MNFKDVYNLFFEPGEVTEIRSYGFSRTSKIWQGFAMGTGIVYGYFDNADDFALAAAALEKKNAPASAIYFTINPCKPELLSRAANRLKAPGPKPIQTSDKDIKCVRWIPIDIDPVRAAGISSTDEQLTLAIKTRNEISAWLGEKYKCGRVLAMSGNGAHLLVKIEELESTDENKSKMREALHGLADKFETDKVDVDLAVFNQARIMRLYGTTAKKGDHTELRPHRKSYIEEVL